MSKPTLVVVYGFKGDLSKRKLLPAFWTVARNARERELDLQFEVIGVDTTPIASTIEEWVTENLSKKIHPFPPRGWKEFLGRFSYQQISPEPGGAKALFEKIAAWTAKHPQGRVRLYLAVPYVANIPILKQLSEHCKSVNCAELSIFLEKPAEITEEALAQIDALRLACGIPEQNIGIVEHFFTKPGVQNFIRSAFVDLTNNVALRGDHITDVYLTVREKVGTEGRAYPGTFVDSIINHVAFLLGITLGNPVDNGLQHMLINICSRLGRLSFSPSPELSEEVLDTERKRFFDSLRPRGIYGRCIEDHCKPHETPTAVLLEFFPTTNRWTGSTRWVLEHSKNSPEKVNMIEFIFKSRPGELGSRWRYYFEKVDGSDRYYGWEKFGVALRADMRGTTRVVDTNLIRVEPEYTDGYPQVVQAVIDGRMDQFMPLNFQRASLKALMPWAAALDKVPVEDGIRFHKGQLPFDEIDFDRLFPLS